jgi:hypothetical protein
MSETDGFAAEPDLILFPDLPPKPPTPQDVLSLPLPQPNDADAATVRDYLIALLHEVWREEEGFSGKRPFGNSSWQFDLYVPMARARWIELTLDEDGYIDDFPIEARHRADSLIYAAIHALGEPAGEEGA